MFQLSKYSKMHKKNTTDSDICFMCLADTLVMENKRHTRCVRVVHPTETGAIAGKLWTVKTSIDGNLKRLL